MKIRAADLAAVPGTLAILASFALPALSSLVSQDKDAACVQQLAAIWKELDAYRRGRGAYPDEPGLLAYPRIGLRRSKEPYFQGGCPATGDTYRFPAGNLNQRTGPAEVDPIFADPLLGVRWTPHGDARSVGANVLYRDGSVRKVTLKDTAAWRAMLVGTRQCGDPPILSAGDAWVFRTTENPDLRVTLTVETIPLDGTLELVAMVYKDSSGRERWRDVVYPTPQGWRFYKRTVAGRTLPVKPSAERARRVAELIDDLASDDPLERMDASEKIAEIWFDVRDAVEEAIARSTDPEVALKLRQAVAAGIGNRGPLLLPSPLAVGASWETPAGEGHTLRHEILDERFIVTALGETHCFQIRSDSPSQTVTTWLSTTHGPVVIQFVSKADGTKVEWRVESRKDGLGRAVWMCPFCGEATTSEVAEPGRPSCESCGIPMQPMPRQPRQFGENIEPCPEPVPVPHRR